MRQRASLAPRRRALLACGALLSAPACVSSSIDADLRRVRELTRVEQLPRVAEAAVEPAPGDDVRRLLQDPLDADGAVRIALLNNRELRATLRELGIARGRLLQAGLLPNPRAEIELLPERNTQVELRVEYDLSGLLLAPQRQHALEPELEAARYRAASALVELGYRVRLAFYRVQAAAKRHALVQQMLDAVAASRDAVQAMFEAGNVAALDFASQEVAYQKARITLSQFELELSTDREALQRLLGLHGAVSGWRLRGELAEAPEQPSLPEALESNVLRASLELKESKQRLEGLARRTGVARRSGWLPDVTLDVHVLHGERDTEGAPASEDGTRVGAGVSFTLPVFDRNQGTTSALEAEFDALLERYYGLAVELRSLARDAASRVASSHARTRQYKGVILPAQRRVSQETLLQYNAMQVGVFQLLQARRDELDAELAYVDTLREYWSATAELSALLAGSRVSMGSSEQASNAGAAPASIGEH